MQSTAICHIFTRDSYAVTHNSYGWRRPSVRPSHPASRHGVFTSSNDSSNGITQSDRVNETRVGKIG